LFYEWFVVVLWWCCGGFLVPKGTRSKLLSLNIAISELDSGKTFLPLKAMSAGSTRTTPLSASGTTRTKKTDPRHESAPRRKKTIPKPF